MYNQNTVKRKKHQLKSQQMQLNYLSNSEKKNISTKTFINITILLTYLNAECLLLQIACSFVQSKHTNIFQNKQVGSALSFLLLCYLSCYTYFYKSFKTVLFFISTFYGLSSSFSYLYQLQKWEHTSKKHNHPSFCYSFVIIPLLDFCRWPRIKWAESSKAEWLQ